MSTAEWAETVRQHGEAVRATLADIWNQIDHQDREHNGEPALDDCDVCESFEGNYGSLDAREHLDELPLEIVWEPGEPFAVVLGTGGPHVEITGGGRQGGYVLHTYWGEHVQLRGESITRTGEYFREVVDTL